MSTLITNAVAEDAKIKSAFFSIQPAYQGGEIVVTSSDGEKWNKIDAKALKLSAMPRSRATGLQVRRLMIR